MGTDGHGSPRGPKGLGGSWVWVISENIVRRVLQWERGTLTLQLYSALVEHEGSNGGTGETSEFNRVDDTCELGRGAR